MIANPDFRDFEDQPNQWVLVKYVPFEGRQDLAWVNILKVTDSGYLVNEVDSIYLEGDLVDGPFRYIGSTSSKRHLLCDVKMRSKEEIELHEPVRVLSTGEVFSE